MSMDELLTRALLLPEGDRAELAHRLLLSLAPPGPEANSEQKWEQAWMEEIGRRLERQDRGETATRDAGEALADIQAALREPRRGGM
jgi:hypothetical protein